MGPGGRTRMCLSTPYDVKQVMIEQMPSSGDAMTEIASPPAAVPGDIVDDFFGTAVPDPYRALEDANDPRTTAWWRAQNTRSEEYLRSLPHRHSLEQRLTELWTYRYSSAPARHG